MICVTKNPKFEMHTRIKMQNQIIVRDEVVAMTITPSIFQKLNEKIKDKTYISPHIYPKN